ncbi:MAG: hypothetical protein AB8H79_25795 [Myxococcota bacterium]
MADSPSEDLTGAVVGLVQRLARRGRTEISKGLDAGRQQIELRQARRDLEAFWVRLGKTAARLSEADEIDHPAIQKAVSRIRALQTQIDELAEGSADLDPEPPITESHKETTPTE